MDNLQPLICVGNIIPDAEMPTFQNLGVQRALLYKSMLLAFDTGTGKTFTYAMFVRALLNRNPDKKHVFVIIHDSIEQAPADVRRLTKVPVRALSGKDSQVAVLENCWDKTSIIMMTYECFQRNDMYYFLYMKLPEIESFVIDEAHHVANWDVSDMAFKVRALCQYVPYRVGLSATPATRAKQQFYRLMNLLDRDLSPRRDETYLDKYEKHYMADNRADHGIKGNYKVTLEVVPPMQHQIGELKGIIFKYIKGTGAVHQVEALIRIVRERLLNGKRVIVFVHYHDSRQWLERNLEQEGLPFVSLHGKVTSQKARQEILQKFGSGEVNILLTSVSESLNIDADVVVFYEFTTQLKQVMGRAHRGLEAKELELVFIVTRETKEVEFYLEYVYERSLVLQSLLGKDYSEFIAIGEELKNYSIAHDD